MHNDSNTNKTSPANHKSTVQSKFLSILLWNAQSIKEKHPEFKLLVKKLTPSLFGICETWLKGKHKFRIPNYHILRQDREDREGGGIMIGIKNSLEYQRLNLNPFSSPTYTPKMEVMAVKMKVESQWISILLGYNPEKLTQTEMEFYISQLSPPYLLVGDLNAKHKFWQPSLQTNNTSGNELFNTVVNSTSLTVLTPKGQPTRIDPRSGLPSTLDLFIGEDFFRDGVFSLQPQMRSDHIPIYVSFNDKIVREYSGKLPRYVIETTGWKSFQTDINKPMETNLQPSQGNLEDVAAAITDHINKAAGKSFKLSNTRGTQFSGVPWWDKDCEDAVKNRRKAWRKWKKHPSTRNRINYSKLEAISKRTIRTAQSNSWANYCSSLSSTTKTGQTWRFLKAMEGKNTPSYIPLVKDGVMLTDNKSKADYLAEHYATTVGKPTNMVFDSHPNIFNKHLETLSQPFTIKELEEATRNMKNGKSPGHDLIVYEFIKNLTDDIKTQLLHLYNLSWESGMYPKQWKIATIIPLLKNNKDPAEPNSYRHITLLSTLGKLMERLVERRLRWFLESQELIKEELNGFRPRRGTIDCLLLLEHNIRKAQAERKVLLCLFLDLKGAFDSVSHQGVLNQLECLGLSGSPLRWFEDFLKDRTYRVAVGSDFSEERTMLRGLPQGSILSPILFNLVMNTIPDISPSTHIIYADDEHAQSLGNTLESAERHLQDAVPCLEEWLEEWDLTTEISKCRIMAFTNKHLEREPLIVLNGNRIPFTKEHKSLGLYLDGPYLTWMKHIEYLRTSTASKLDVMKRVCGKKWGASRDMMMSYYNKAILSKIEYGSTAYGSASKTVLQKLNVIQNTALRIAIGAFRSSPISALEIEAGQISLLISRKVTNIKTLTSLMRKTASHPMTKEIEYFDPSLKWSKIRKPFIARALESCNDLNIRIPLLWYTTPISPIQPWVNLHDHLHVNMEEISHKASQRPAAKPTFLHMNHQKYKDHKRIFTDGSFCPATLASAAAMYLQEQNTCTSWKLPNEADIAYAELFAIGKACKLIDLHKISKTVIYTDSKSAIYLLLSSKPSAHLELVYQIQSMIVSIIDFAESFHIQWVPSHSSIRGNDIADRGAKLGLQLPNAEDVQLSESIIKRQARLAGLKRWSDCALNSISASSLSLYRKDSNPQPWTRSPNRRLDSGIARLRIGHSGLKHHLHRIGIEESPLCEWCNQEETVEHVLISCYRHHSLRAEFKAQLSLLQVSFTLQNILGGGNFPEETNYKILRFLKAFLKKSGRLAQI